MPFLNYRPSLLFVALGCLVVGLLMGCQQLRPRTQAPAGIEEPLPEAPREFRAAWIATVANIDWPSEPGLPVDSQKAEMRRLLDRAAALNLNAVIFQVRPAADALYDSPHEPWSEYLTGQMGEPPEPYYDPLAFAVKEAHRRGLELHAWFNPYRALHASATSEVSEDHISQTTPDIVREYGDYLWLDPGEPEAHTHTMDVIMDVVERYDIDGVHFDDYFYPYPSYGNGAPFPDSASWARAQKNGWTGSRDEWRRHNVDRLVESLYREIKATAPHVQFGISPFGIWRPGHPERTTGFDAHDVLYADARKWLREGWVDYLTPQLYYQMDQVAQPFPIMLRWWSDQNEQERHLWPGLYTSRVMSTGDRQWPVQELTGQIYTARSHPGVDGAVHFSMQALQANPERLTDRLAAGPYAESALVPSSPWLDDDAPSRPSVSVDANDGAVNATLTPGGDQEVRWWAVYTYKNQDWATDVVPGARRELTVAQPDPATWPEAVAVTAVDRNGNESPAATARLPRPREQSEDTVQKADALKPDIIPRSAWAEVPPGGVEANAIRRNLSPGDTLHVRDLTVVLEDMSSGVPPTVGLGVPPGMLLSELASPDTAHLHLKRHGVQETRPLPEEQAINWNDYHLGVLSAKPNESASGSGLAELEVGTVSSLSVDRAAAMTTGGADQRLRVPHTIDRITLHHTGSAEPLTADDNPREKLRGLLSWGREERNWWDVPYHYLIDLEGRIYEGRATAYMGETNTEYNPRGHLLVSVMGNYNLQEPTDAQIEALADLSAWLVATHDLSLNHIGGHSDWADTSCPGRHLQPWIETNRLQEAIEERLSETSSP